MTSEETLLRALFAAAIASAAPANCLPPFLPPPPRGKLIILAGGKAAASMTAAALAHYRENFPSQMTRVSGLAVTRRLHTCPTAPIELIEAGHPIPDAIGATASERILDLAGSAQADDLVLVLLSGGASALWVAPALGVDLAAKQALTKALLRAGANILEINTVRRHLSRIKGGRLAKATAGASVLTLAISDVPGDDPVTIGSGPTAPDPSTLADARAVLTRYRLAPSPPIGAALSDPANESPKPGDPDFLRTRYEIVARPKQALAAAAEVAAKAGYQPILLGDAIEGEARAVATAHARLARELAAGGGRLALLSGGELTVRVTGAGKGGPNQEYALALALALGEDPRFHALAGDTDGSDGGDGAPDAPAGAIVDMSLLKRAAMRGLDAAAFLANNDSTSFLTALAASLSTGPTLTNVNDFRAILVDSEKAIAR